MSRIPGFYKLPPGERLAALEGAGADAAILEKLRAQPLSLEAADLMVENVVSMFALPNAVAVNFLIDSQDRFVPMVVEEPSVVAAASNAARMARGHGGFRTSHTGDVMAAQIQILDAVDPEGVRMRVLEARDELVALANDQDPVLVQFGGGARDVTARVISTRVGPQVIVHLHVGRTIVTALDPDDAVLATAEVGWA